MKRGQRMLPSHNTLRLTPTYLPHTLLLPNRQLQLTLNIPYPLLQHILLLLHTQLHLTPLPLTLTNLILILHNNPLLLLILRRQWLQFPKLLLRGCLLRSLIRIGVELGDRGEVSEEVFAFLGGGFGGLEWVGAWYGVCFGGGGFWFGFEFGVEGLFELGEFFDFLFNGKVLLDLSWCQPLWRIQTSFPLGQTHRKSLRILQTLMSHQIRRHWIRRTTILLLNLRQKPILL